MLLELAAANTAYATIKASIAAGRELHAVGTELATYFGAKSELAKRVDSSKKPKNELDEFMALETLRHQEQELKQMMIYGGRAGLWDDWLQYQAKAARDRKEAVRNEAVRKHKRNAAIQDMASTGIKAGLIILIIMGALFGVALHFYER